MNPDRYIADLVEKFLDGRTTNSEERELYAWFRTHDIPEEWAPLKSMFAWYEAGMPEEVVVEEEQRPIVSRSRVVPLRRWLQLAGGCVAILAVVIFLFRGDMVDSDTSPQGGDVNNVVAIVDDDLMRRADLIEQQAYELLAWAEMNSL